MTEEKFNKEKKMKKEKNAKKMTLQEEDDFLKLVNNAYVPWETQLLSMGEVFRLWKQGALVLKCDFQREFIWKKYDQSNLIESFLVHHTIPPVQLIESILEEGVIKQPLDGLQRLTTVCEFMDNKFRIHFNKKERGHIINKEIRNMLEGKKFENLGDRVQARFEHASIPTVILSDARVSKATQRYMYRRINTGVKKANAMEIRHAAFAGDFMTLVKDLTLYKPFIDLLGIKKDGTFIKRATIKEYVIKFLGILELGYEGVYDARNYGNFIDKVCEEMTDTPPSARKLKLMENTFKKAIDICYKAFGDGAFNYRPFETGGTKKPTPCPGIYGAIVPVIGEFVNKKYGDLMLLKFKELNTLYNKLLINPTWRKNVDYDHVQKKHLQPAIEVWRTELNNFLGKNKHLDPSIDNYNEPRNYSNKFRESFFIEKKGICENCGYQMKSLDEWVEIDHNFDYNFGGKTTKKNAQLLCKDCNHKKHKYQLIKKREASHSENNPLDDVVIL